MKEKGAKAPYTSTDYYDLFDKNKVDAVVITTEWRPHLPLSIEAMEAGIPVACEVGGAYSVDDCWRLVRTYKRTKTLIMFLENCCYGRRELMALHTVRQGLLGDTVHCRGGYLHDIRDELILKGTEQNQYRLKDYLYRNCENYPTHELGPIAKIPDINRGNRFVSLTSTASCARGLNEYAAEKLGTEYSLTSYHFPQGDIITTVICCTNGKTVTTNLDTSLPRWYSRDFYIRGTKELISEENRSVYLENSHIPYEINKEATYYEKYNHPIWKKFCESGVRGGHGGMDGLEFDAFYAALREGMPMPIDVYDMAALTVISPLSEQSVACGSAP